MSCAHHSRVWCCERNVFLAGESFGAQAYVHVPKEKRKKLALVSERVVSLNVPKEKRKKLRLSVREGCP